MARGTWGGALDPHPLKVRISWTRGTSKEQTGFYLRDVSLTPVDVQDAANDVRDWAEANFRTLLATTDTLDGVDVVDVTTGEGGSASPTVSAGTAVVGSDATPGFVCVAISLKGELRRRYGQGRMMWPIRSEQATSNDVLSAGGVTIVNTVLNSLRDLWIGDHVGQTYKMINVHGPLAAGRPTGTVPNRPAVAASWYDVTSARVNNVLTALRSRKAGVGS